MTSDGRSSTPGLIPGVRSGEVGPALPLLAGHGPVRLLIMACSAIHRRAIAELLPRLPGFDLVATCASPSMTRDKLLREIVDVVVIDAALDPATRQSLEVLAQERQVVFRTFACDPSSVEETGRRVVEALYAHHPVKPDDLKPARRSIASTEELALVAIGSSTGGPDALGELIPLLPRHFRPTVLISQHMPANFTPILARRLDKRSHLEVREAVHGEPIRPGCVLVAPGDYHLEVEADGSAVRLHQGPLVNFCRPSVDVLFRSVAQAFGRRALGVVLTGMGRDGLDGSRLLRGAGAEVLVQDEASSVVWGMPGLIAREGLSTAVASLTEIAKSLIERNHLISHGSPARPEPEPARNP